VRRRFAQHFLEPAWARRVVQAIGPAPDDTFLEIGPGTGALTKPLAATGARIVAIEIDRDLAARLAAEAPPNVRVLQGDFLTVDLVAALGAEGLVPRGTPAPDRPDTPPWGGPPLRAVGNLPYRVSTSILLRLIELQQRHGLFRDATLMVQKEVADRLVASPGSRQYGVLSVFVQLDAEVTPLLVLPPGAFRPMPKVRSALVRLVFRPRPVAVADARVFGHLVRGLFTRRRKTMLNALRPLADAAGVSADAVLARAGLDPRRRPETLDLSELATLAAVFASAGSTSVL